MGTNNDFDKCNFVNTEVNHDLNPPINTNLNNNIHFEKIRTDLGPLCRSNINFNDPSVQFSNDAKIVETVLGMTIPNIINLPKNIPLNVNVLISNNVDGKSIMLTNGATIYKCIKPYNNSSILNLFNYTVVNNDTFCIIDTGDNLIQAVKAIYIQPPVKNFNIIHSYATISDSAPKTKPDSKNYVNKNNTVGIYSWLYNKDYVINNNDPLLISKYKITNSIAGLNWNIAQEWRETPGNINTNYTTNNAHKENSKPLAIIDLKKQLLNPTTINDKKFSLSIQKKRSGDYSQIHAAKNFPRDALTHTADFLLIRPNPPTVNFSNKINGLTEDQIRNATHFITGDWPAFAYSIYNKVNSIMILKHPKDQNKSFIISVKFV
jgi:hypothetical protein